MPTLLVFPLQMKMYSIRQFLPWKMNRHWQGKANKENTGGGGRQFRHFAGVVRGHRGNTSVCLVCKKGSNFQVRIQLANKLSKCPCVLYASVRECMMIECEAR